MDYDAIKQSVTMREVAEQYGFAANRNSLILCPFHDDRNPSCRLYENSFYCFSCGAGGDVINFVALLHKISNSDAAAKLAGDYSVTTTPYAIVKRRREREKAEKFKRWEHDAFDAILVYRNLLRDYQRMYEYPHPLYIKALTETERVEYMLDIFTYSSMEEKLKYYIDKEMRGEIDGYIANTGRYSELRRAGLQHADSG